MVRAGNPYRHRALPAESLTEPAGRPHGGCERRIAFQYTPSPLKWIRRRPADLASPVPSHPRTFSAAAPSFPMPVPQYGYLATRTRCMLRAAEKCGPGLERPFPNGIFPRATGEHRLTREKLPGCGAGSIPGWKMPFVPQFDGGKRSMGVSEICFARDRGAVSTAQAGRIGSPRGRFLRCKLNGSCGEHRPRVLGKLRRVRAVTGASVLHRASLLKPFRPMAYLRITAARQVEPDDPRSLPPAPPGD